MLRTLKKRFLTMFVSHHHFEVCEYWEISRRLARLLQGVHLDLECGTGLQAILLSRKSHMTNGMDISDPQLRAAPERLRRWSRTRVNFLCGDLFDLQHSTGLADAVVSVSMLQLIPHWRETLSGISRLLKPRSQLVISVDSLEAIEDPSLIRKHREVYSVQQCFSAFEFGREPADSRFSDGASKSHFQVGFCSTSIILKSNREQLQIRQTPVPRALLKLRLAGIEQKGRNNGVCLIADATK